MNDVKQIFTEYNHKNTTVKLSLSRCLLHAENLSCEMQLEKAVIFPGVSNPVNSPSSCLRLIMCRFVWQLWNYVSVHLTLNDVFIIKKTVYIKTSDRIKVEMIESRKNEERKQKYLIRAWYNCCRKVSKTLKYLLSFPKIYLSCYNDIFGMWIER